jgi:hypothetical protein
MFFGIRNNLWKAVRHTRRSLTYPPSSPPALNPVSPSGPRAPLGRFPSTTSRRACAIPALPLRRHVSSSSRSVLYTPTFGFVSEPPFALRSAWPPHGPTAAAGAQPARRVTAQTK